MAFHKMDKAAFPPRHWSLFGAPGSGKSTFAARMRGPLLLIDADHRFAEVAALAAGDVYELSENAIDHIEAERIVACLRAGMPGVTVGTIIVDSLTAILSPLVTAAIQSNDRGENKNRMVAWKTKALAMRAVQDAVTAWGTDTLWIYHERPGRDAQGAEVLAASIPRTELARLQRSLNLRLLLVQEGERRGVTVQWARRGRSGMTIWDDSGTWVQMPERIEQAVYGGLSAADQERIAAATPTGFASADLAIAWGFEQGCFEALPHARAAYDKLRPHAQPSSASEMWQLWIADVQRRVTEMAGLQGA